ncbi:MAG: SpoIID/LytB domain-containing protein [Coriobacteriia bacterium]|nr:SpoIID/LytB domain-containing protein [Coriobacteriia bacterium]
MRNPVVESSHRVWRGRVVARARWALHVLRACGWQALAAAVILGTIVVAAHCSPAFAAEQFVFIGRGNGHGLGMSQYGAKGFAERGYRYQSILRHYYGSGGTDERCTVGTSGPEPKRDINLDPSADYGSNGGFTRTQWSIRPGHTGSSLAVYSQNVVYVTDAAWSYFTADGDRVVWATSDGKTRMSFPGTVAVWETTGTPKLTQVLEGTGIYGEGYIRYRGELRITARSGRLKLVNRVPMRDYLYGVVPREMPSTWHAEALRAQAIAARGYAWTSTRTELYTDTRDQAYAGHSSGFDRDNPDLHEAASTNDAVDSTTGLCVLYDGTRVRTYFMSTSGGHTENNENVWFPASGLPYLRGVPDPYEAGSGSPWHSWSRVTLDATTLRQRLVAQGIPEASVPATITQVRAQTRGVSGRLTALKLLGADGPSLLLDSTGEIAAFRRAVGFRDTLIFVNPRTSRIAGPDRYATSVSASQRVFGKFVTPAHVVLVNGDAPVDAMSASALAGACGGAPILFCTARSVPESVMQEIARLGVRNAYIVGGSGIVQDSVQEQLANAGVAVTRLWGPDRYATASAVAREVKRLAPATRAAVIVNGSAYADGLVASAVAYSQKWPVILVSPSAVPTVSADALRALGATSTLVVGGDKVIYDVVLKSLPAPRRVGGDDRYATADAIRQFAVDNLGFNLGSIYIASGEACIDALSLGPVAGYNRNPILLCRSYSLTSPTEATLSSLASTLNMVHIAGGDGSVSGWLEGCILRMFELAGR